MKFPNKQKNEHLTFPRTITAVCDTATDFIDTIWVHDAHADVNKL